MDFLERIQEECKLKKGFLDISGCGLKELPIQLLEMPWLTHLYATNNELSQITNLNNCSSLKVLYLSYNNILSIQNLGSLKELEKLYLDTNKITRINGLKELVNLKVLDISDNPIYWIKGLKEVVNLPNLGHLNISGIKNTDLNIPKEYFSPSLKNSISLLKGYFETTRFRATTIKEIPIILVGNPTAGKTSLRYFLKENIFPPLTNFSTHGIVCDFWQPENDLTKQFIEDNSLENVQFYFWDFGGQEYYHSTHRLFFSSKAIYILLWDEKSNLSGKNKISLSLISKEGNLELIDKSIDLFPFQYWLSNIRYYAPNSEESPILLVQNKLDSINNRKEVINPEILSQTGNCYPFSLSIKQAYERKLNGRADPSFDSFLEKLFHLGKQHLSVTSYGSEWLAIKQILIDNRNDNIWNIEKFIEELQNLDSTISPNGASSYALSLKAMGLIFYYPEDDYLQQFIFINPSWITAIIYKILDITVLENGGEFSKKHIIDKIGGVYSKVFIHLMKKFELIFENEELDLFVAPQYLPDDLLDIRKVKELNRRFNDLLFPDFVMQFENFFPNSTMLRFLSTYGSFANEKYYWKNGISFTLEKKLVLVLFIPSSNTFKIFVEDHDLFIQRLIFDKILELTEQTNKLKIGTNENHLVSYLHLHQQVKIGNPKVLMDSGETDNCNKFKHFFEDIQIVKRMSKLSNNTNKEIKIFISYSHKDQKIKEEFVDKYLKSISNHYSENVIVWNDAELKSGNVWDKRIKLELSSSKIVIFLLSNSFLSSDYIKNIEIMQTLEGFKKKEQIILPICIEEIPLKLSPFKNIQCILWEKPLTEWVNKNKAWQKVVNEILNVIDDIQSDKLEHYFN